MAVSRFLATVGLALAVTAGFAAPALADAKPVTPAAPSTAAVPGGYSSWADLYAEQAKLDTAAAAISAADTAGNASIVVSAEKHQVRVYCAGAIPTAVRSAADATGVQVNFHPATFTHTQLFNEARRIAPTGNGVVAAAPRADGSGLTVTVSSALDQARQARLASLTHMPLTVEVGKGAQALFGRQADTPAFWAARATTPRSAAAPTPTAGSTAHKSRFPASPPRPATPSR